MKDTLRILLIGKGGREGALASKILESPRTEKLFTTPAELPGAECAGIPVMDFEALRNFVENSEIDLVVVGPEAPIVGGIADALASSRAKVIAPDTECARLEGSKEFAKEFMTRHAIPSPRFMTVTTDTLDEGLSFLDSLRPPYVVKADGLAAGRGVLITSGLADAKDALQDMLDGLFGNSSSTVVLEEFVEGPECSVFLAVDGEDYVILSSARDYKRYEEGNTGLNTGGLGAVSPSPEADGEFMQKVERNIILPTLRGLKEEGMDYRGFLYLGLKDVDGEPVMLEYNVRLGDPETQVLMPRLESDIVDLFEGMADRTLALKRVNFSDKTAVGIVLAAKGYPGFVEKGDAVTGIEAAQAMGCIVYDGAMRIDHSDGSIYTDGGRILTIVGLNDSVEGAAQKALEGASAIDYRGKYFRHDIGS